MSTPDDNSNAELIGLLEELGNQKERMLLNSSLTRLRKDLTKPVAPFSSRMAGLSNLEEHLLDVHREELIRLFVDACFRVLATDKRIAGHLMFNRTDCGGLIRPKPKGVWDRNARCLMATRAFEEGSRSSRDLIHELLREGAHISPGLEEIASAGEMVGVSEALRIYRARGMEEHGGGRVSTRALMRTFSCPIDHRNQTVVAMVLGKYCQEADDHGRAVHWYRESLNEHGSSVPGIVFFAIAAAQAGDLKSFALASALLGERVRPNDSDFLAYISRARAGLLAGSWRLTNESQEIARLVNDHNETTRQVLALFC